MMFIKELNKDVTHFLSHLCLRASCLWRQLVDLPWGRSSTRYTGSTKQREFVFEQEFKCPTTMAAL